MQHCHKVDLETLEAPRCLGARDCICACWVGPPVHARPCLDDASEHLSQRREMLRELWNVVSKKSRKGVA